MTDQTDDIEARVLYLEKFVGIKTIGDKWLVVEPGTEADSAYSNKVANELHVHKYHRCSETLIEQLEGSIDQLKKSLRSLLGGWDKSKSIPMLVAALYRIHFELKELHDTKRGDNI